MPYLDDSDNLSPSASGPSSDTAPGGAASSALGFLRKGMNRVFLPLLDAADRQAMTPERRAQMTDAERNVDARFQRQVAQDQADMMAGEPQDRTLRKVNANPVKGKAAQDVLGPSFVRG